MTARTNKFRWSGFLSHGLVLAVFGFVAGYLANDFVNFRTSQRELLKLDFAEERAVAEQVDVQLRLLSLVAQSKETRNNKSTTALNDSLLKLRNQAESIAMRASEIRPRFQEYAEAMVNLNEAAQALNAPDMGGHAFVVAVSEFYSARRRFEAAVVEQQSRYWTF